MPYPRNALRSFPLVPQFPFPLVSLSLLLFALIGSVHAQDSLYVLQHYSKHEARVPMRDGIRLFTSIYSPRDTTQSWPIMLNRTPYSVSPYGPDTMKSSLGPSSVFLRDGFIFVYQDVRGRYMSEGVFEDMRPQIDGKKSSEDIDESSDTYDTIEWLLKNVRHNNGMVGIWGISYPGFYAAAGMISNHPALKASSPQAPIADWFIGDDFHHNGAFFLFDGFSFFSGFGQPRPVPTTVSAKGVSMGMPDPYRFYLNLGPVKNANNRYLHGKVKFWNDATSHGTYDEFWQARNLLPHIRDIAPAVMVVGGLFDAEDLYGPFAIYRTLVQKSPSTRVTLVAGPWQHGGWARTSGARLGQAGFGARTSYYYRDSIELPFFRHYLKGSDNPNLPPAIVFETGSNTWHRYDRWPPPAIERSIYLRENSLLSFEPPTLSGGYDEYVSDPARPVPYTGRISPSRGTTYMAEDQRFAFMRPDVLSYESPTLTQPLHVAGPVTADLYVSTTGTDADFIVKLIDVFPDSLPDPRPNPERYRTGGYQMLVRAEVMRGKFRDSFEKPEPFTPGQIARVRFELRDVSHAFLRGHRMMVQVQSSWFPLVDRNPQKFVDIYSASESDFQKATIRVYRQNKAASRLVVNVRADGAGE